MRQAAEHAPDRPHVVVTGATGTVGRLVTRKLAAADRCAVSAFTRDPAAARRAGLPGRLVGGDFEDPASLRAAFRAADAVLVVTDDPLRPEHDHNIVQAASAAGVGRLVKLSALAVTDAGADDLITRWQRANEQRIAASGIPCTLLRPRAFMSHALAWTEAVRGPGLVEALYCDSRNACVDPDDIADAAVAALTGGAEDAAYALTGPAAISARDQVDSLSRLTGRELRCVELAPDQARARWRRRWPEPVVEALAGSAERQRSGAKAHTADGVRAATGRSPGSFARWAERHLAAFGGTVRDPGAQGQGGGGRTEPAGGGAGRTGPGYDDGGRHDG